MTDYRALITKMANELDQCHRLLMDDRRQRHPLADHARAALAEADGPAVSDDREPASVATQPSDEEIMGLMPQQMHDDLAAAVRAMAEQEGIDSTPAKGVLRIILNRHVVDLARAVLARLGRPPPQPVAVRETWSEFSDCGQQEEVWVWNPVLDHWTLSRINRHVHTHWLPANALLTPEATNE